MSHNLLKYRILSDKVDFFQSAKAVIPPRSGWITAIRTSLNMTLAQLGKKTGKTKQSIAGLERSEAEGTITLNSLRDTANALDMQLVYAIVPRTATLEDHIRQRAESLAREIVGRTHQQMVLEAQQVSGEDQELAVKDLADELIRKMDRSLWD